MLTRCPACATHFRITPAQLKARSGSVRCGECQHVFNALDSLIEEPLAVVAPPRPESPPQSVPAFLSGTEMAATTSSAARMDEVAAPPAPTSEPPPEAPDELAALQPEAQEAPGPEPAEAAEPGTVAEVEATDGSWNETFPEPPPPPHRWPWLIGSVLALTAMGLQAAVAFRVELAVLWPAAKPALVALCNMADCEVGLPAKVGLVGIEASDLHPDNEHQGRLALTATLKNRAPFVQQFPHLELTLTDTADQAIARKVLVPADYLPPTASITNGMQPGADIAVAVSIDSGEMAASGYRLYLFYP
ncbi:MAG: zinc-ribbon domain-containing protein [Sulfuritalea sp.]|jgi:predicted Zn finger-like uncharacterized protein|nr:zinc-ribbon domain-containing protein [Sulfuritalea sp.]